MADETERRLFLVEHDLRGLSAWQLATVHRTLGEAVRRENQRGGRIRYVQCIYAPDEQRCLCLFEAAGPEPVRSVNDLAQFPLARVMAVLSSVPDDGATKRHRRRRPRALLPCTTCTVLLVIVSWTVVSVAGHG
jgi:hypothetical protein